MNEKSKQLVATLQHKLSFMNAEILPKQQVHIKNQQMNTFKERNNL